MTQTPLDRLKLAALQIAQWSAFINLLIIVYWLGAFFLYAEPRFLRPSEVFLGEFLEGYGDLMAKLFGDDTAVFFVSPTLWLILWITTGNPRFLPWNHK
jgi:hypothetical protein